MEAQIKEDIDDDKDEVVRRQELLTNHPLISGHSVQVLDKT